MRRAATLRRATTSFITTAAGVSAIATGLAIIDPRVHSEVAALLTPRGAADDVVGFWAHAQELASVAMQAVRDQGIEHAPLTLFALVALLLFVLMFRT